MPATHPVNVFFCYAPQDEELHQELEKHLSQLEREGYVKGWSASTIGAGEDARREIERQIDRADLILLLVSADFLASDQIYDLEFQRALARRMTRKSRVIAVLLRPCDWRSGPIRDLVRLPAGEKPVTTWPSTDEAFARIVDELKKVIDDTRAGRISKNPLRAHPQEAPGG